MADGPSLEPSEAAGAGGAGGSVPTGGGGAAAGSASYGGSGTAGTTLAGNAGNAGAPVVDTTCGGELLGNWVSINREDGELEGAKYIDNCVDLSLVVVNGELYAFTAVPPGPRQASYMIFDANGGFVGDGSFLSREQSSGPVMIDYPSKCLQTPEGPVDCAQLTEALTQLSFSDDTFTIAACAARESGCRCTFQTDYNRAVGGFYTVDRAAGKITFQNVGGADQSFDSTYCVDRATGLLRFGVGIERVSPVAAGLSYSNANCFDGHRGPAEIGPDCGPVCNNTCP